MRSENLISRITRAETVTFGGIYEWEIVNEVSQIFLNHSESYLSFTIFASTAHEIQWQHVRHHVWSAVRTSAIVWRIFVMSNRVPKNGSSQAQNDITNNYAMGFKVRHH